MIPDEELFPSVGHREGVQRKTEKLPWRQHLKRLKYIKKQIYKPSKRKLALLNNSSSAQRGNGLKMFGFCLEQFLDPTKNACAQKFDYETIQVNLGKSTVLRFSAMVKRGQALAHQTKKHPEILFTKTLERDRKLKKSHGRKPKENWRNMYENEGKKG